MNTLKVGFIASLTLSMIILVFCLIGIVFNPHGFWTFWANVQSGAAQALHALAVGAIILFFAFLGLGIAWAAVHIRTKAHVITPTRYGPTQAVQLRDGNWLQLASPAQQIDPMQQLQMLRTVMQMQGQMAQLARRSIIEDTPQVQQIAAPPTQLPTMVRYEDIKGQIPQNHALVGIGEQGVTTRERAIKALIWIVGGSGSGKTNSACLRVQEDYEWGHYFLLIDPHWFKKDSLWNAIKGYRDRFIVPVSSAERPFASETEDVITWLDWFINEFKRRKAGGSWKFPITILIEEIGSLVTDKTDDPREIEMREKIKIVTRICGQETRDFEMSGMCLSQDAAGLAWLRKRAIMVIAHQLLMMSERLLACNENTEIARSMDDWPIGRTLIYGIGFKEGQRVYQQPVFQPRIVDSVSPVTEQMARHSFRSPASAPLEANGQREEAEAQWEVAQEAGGSDGSKNTDPVNLSTIKELRNIGKRLKEGEEVSDIVKSYGLPYGRGTQQLKTTVEMVRDQMLANGEL